MYVKQTARFSETRIDDEVVLMNLDSGDFFSLTGTAAAIWSLIDGTRGRAEILAALSADYGAPQAEIAEDMDAFLARLTADGYLTER